MVCYDVLEHLKFPERALSRLIEVLEPGGVIVIKGPIPQSLQGLVTRFTPHWFHVLFYRWMWPSSQAGQPGFAPFLTEHSGAARPEAIRGTLRSAGLEELQDPGISGALCFLKETQPIFICGIRYYRLDHPVSEAARQVWSGKFGVRADLPKVAIKRIDPAPNSPSAAVRVFDLSSSTRLQALAVRLSMNALSVGVPGREKSSTMPRW